jgi:hypothetical protein
MQARGGMTSHLQQAQAAHRKAKGLKIRKRIFRPLALNNFDCNQSCEDARLPSDYEKQPIRRMCSTRGKKRGSGTSLAEQR